MPLCKAWTRGDSIAELSARLARAQSKMRDNMIDALLLTTEANVRYFTGYHSPFWHSPTRPWFVVVPSTGRPVAVIPTIGADAFNRNGFVDVVTWPAPRPEDDGISDLVQVPQTLQDLQDKSVQSLVQRWLYECQFRISISFE